MSNFESAEPCVLWPRQPPHVFTSTFSNLKMKAQGKIAELNVSSHCHQSSKTVGRMSETYEPQAFLGISLNSSAAKAPMCEPLSVEDPPTQTLQRTIARKARRRRAAERKREAILESLPDSATEEDKAWACYPTAMKQRTDADNRTAARRSKHACYVATIATMNHSRVYGAPFRMSQEAHQLFEQHYKGEEVSHWTVSPELLMELEDLHHGTLTPSINFQHFPEADLPAIERSVKRARTVKEPTPPQLGMPDYEPQSGSLETCANLLDSYDKVVASPLYGQVISLLKWENPFLSTAALLATSFSLFVIKTCVMTFNFLFGCLIGVIFINKPPSYKYMPQSGRLDNLKTFTQVLSKVSTIASAILAVIVTLSRDQGKSVTYSPQSGLTPDDGAKFLGKVVPKTGNVPDMPDSTPGVTALNSVRNQVFPRTAPPKISKKDPNDGPLNGFGIGI